MTAGVCLSVLPRSRVDIPLCFMAAGAKTQSMEAPCGRPVTVVYHAPPPSRVYRSALAPSRHACDHATIGVRSIQDRPREARAGVSNAAATRRGRSYGQRAGYALGCIRAFSSPCLWHLGGTGG